MFVQDLLVLLRFDSNLNVLLSVLVTLLQSTFAEGGCLCLLFEGKEARLHPIAVILNSRLSISAQGASARGYSTNASRLIETYPTSKSLLCHLA